jgi:glycosyltransferase involved in cell wall biosynthesis
MLISVIITCYNLERYIAEAIESVLHQDCDPTLYEIIVVDDCSTDSSSEIIGTFESIRYIKSPLNQGVLLATVLGIEHARGDVIAFLDGDDIWRSDKLSRLAAKYQEDNELVFLTHNYQFIDERGKPKVGLEYTQKIFDSIEDKVQISKLIVDGILYRRNYVWLGSAYSIRLNAIQKSSFINWVNDLPNPRLTYQDWPLAFWIAASCPGRFGYDPEKLFLYRIHSANFSGDSKSIEKAIRNWSKSYYTSLAMLNMSEKFSCDQSVVNVCRAFVVREEMILRLFHSPNLFKVREIFDNYLFFDSQKNWLKEFVRVILIKTLGIKVYFRFIQLLSH